MATNKSLIDTKKLDLSIFSNLFKDKPHDFYVMYDDVADELIMKFKKLSSPTSVYHYEDDAALIVELKSYEVVGLIFFDYSVRLRPKLIEFDNSFEEKIRQGYFNTYRTMRYRPKDKKSASIDNVLSRTERVLKKSDAKLVHA